MKKFLIIYAFFLFQTINSYCELPDFIKSKKCDCKEIRKFISVSYNTTKKSLIKIEKYDSNGSITQINEYYPDKSFIYNYYYGKNGKIESEIDEIIVYSNAENKNNAENPFKSDAHQNIKFKDKFTIPYYYLNVNDSNLVDSIITNNSLKYNKIIIENQFGNIEKTITRSPQKRNEIEYFIYNPSQNLIEKTITSNLGASKKYQYELDNKGVVIKCIETNSHHVRTDEILYEYGKNGELLKMDDKIFDTVDVTRVKFTKRTDFYYNEKGNLLKEMDCLEYYSDFWNIYQYEYTY